MTHKGTLALILSALMLTVAGTSGIASAGHQDDAMRFGMYEGATQAQDDAGVPPDYASFWIGPWTLEHGWNGPAQAMEDIHDAGATPAVHLYYWGDDISPRCVEKGCYSDLHGLDKTPHGWQQLVEEFVDVLDERMDGEPVVVFLETEFNKNGIETHEPFDAQLADKISYIQDEYPAADVVLPFGNWGHGSWDTFDEAADAADYIGVQGMAASTQDDHDTYRNLYEDVLEGAETANELFDQDVFVTDIALSSYPEPAYRGHQAHELGEFFDGMDELKDAGVHAMIYRSWTDTPGMDPNNYYGEAERYWGLLDEDGDPKPAGKVWINGVQNERTLTADFETGQWAGHWWVEVTVDSTTPVDEVEVKINGDDWQTLEPTDWGTYAKPLPAPDGSTVQYRVVDAYGQTTTSTTETW